MVNLSDDEMRTVMELAEPVCPYDRGRFLRGVAVRLFAAKPPHTPHKDSPQLIPNLVVRIATSRNVPPPG
jgi:hypothetical protein